MSEMYRLLETGDTTKEGDEVLMNGQWKPAQIGVTLCEHDFLPRRRIIDSSWPEPLDFNKVGSPDPNKPVMMFHRSMRLWNTFPNTNRINTTLYTHWLPLPPPPEPAKEPWEVALANHVKQENNGHPLPIEEKAFRAGFLAAKAGAGE